MSDFLDFIADQRSKSDLADWAQSQYGQSNPGFAQLAAADPDTFRKLLPTIMQQSNEQNAINSAYDLNKPPPAATPSPSALLQLADGNYGDQQPNAPIPQTLPALDQQGLSLQPQAVQPPQQPSALQKLAGSMAFLPPALQALVGQQLMYSGIGGDGAGGGLSKQAQAIASYKEAPVTGNQLKSPQGMALQNMVLDANPDYDATKYKERQKVATDISPGGVLGQKLSAAETAINHLSSMMDASSQLGGVNASFVSQPINAVRNYFHNQDPALIGYNRFANMSGDEIAKFVAGASGGTLEDRTSQKDALTVNNSPKARQAAAQAAVQTMFGKLEPIADQYNKAYDDHKTAFDFLSPETQKSLTKLGMSPDGTSDAASTAYAPAQSALAQIAAPQSQGQVYVNPQTGARITKVNGKWVPVQ